MTKLSAKQIRAAHLEATGMKAVDIAEEIGVTAQTISAYRKKEEYQIIVSKCAQANLKAAQLKLVELSTLAVQTMYAVMMLGEDKLKLQAATTVLDYLGMSDVRGEIGSTSIAELKLGCDPASDLYHMKIIHQKVDDYLTDVSGV